MIKNICWWRRKGFAVETSLHGDVSHQSIVPYQINSALHQMIRDSPHNSRRMLSEVEAEAEAFDTASDESDE